MTHKLRRVALLLVLATGLASCRLFTLGDRMPDPGSPLPVERSQAAEATQVPADPPPETPAPPSDPVTAEPSPTIEIPPPID